MNIFRTATRTALLCSPAPHAARWAHRSTNAKKAAAPVISAHASIGGLQIATPTVGDVFPWLLNHPLPTLVLAVVAAIVIPRILKVIWRAIVFPAAVILAAAAVFDSPQSAWDGLSTFGSSAAGLVTDHPQWVSLAVIAWLALQLSTRLLPLIVIAVGITWVVAPSKLTALAPQLPSFPGSGLVTRMIPNPFAQREQRALQSDTSSKSAAKEQGAAASSNKRFAFSDSDTAEAPDNIFSKLRRRVESGVDLAKRPVAEEPRVEPTTGLFGARADTQDDKGGILAGLRRRVAAAGAPVTQPEAREEEKNAGWQFESSRRTRDESGEGLLAGLRKRVTAVRELL